MILKGKKVVIMGVRNKWSIAWGAARSAYDQGAEVICTCAEENLEKVNKMLEELPGAKAYVLGDVSVDENIEKCLDEIKKNHGKVDGVLHAIAHANSEDLRNDFVLTSRDGFAHANDVSAYSLVAIVRMLREKDMLNEGASIVAYTYYGSEKAIEGYNVMGVAKAALEASIRYLAKDLGKDGMRINGISAGPIKTLSGLPFRANHPARFQNTRRPQGSGARCQRDAGFPLAPRQRQLDHRGHRAITREHRKASLFLQSIHARDGSPRKRHDHGRFVIFPPLGEQDRIGQHSVQTTNSDMLRAQVQIAAPCEIAYTV